MNSTTKRVLCSICSPNSHRLETIDKEQGQRIDPAFADATTAKALLKKRIDRYRKSLTHKVFENLMELRSTDEFEESLKSAEDKYDERRKDNILYGF